MTPKQRTRVAYLIVDERGDAFDAQPGKKWALKYLNLEEGWRVVRVTYPWPVRPRAKKKK